MKTKEFIIESMSCNHCVMAIKNELSKINLVDSNVQIGSAIITFNESTITEQQIISAIEEAGYKVKKD
ncbi:MAG: heavy-metal-associated domain-containing protein [Ignavibacteria bacterium]|nr:heavy-metal-associated domain-containing protein [Ignavibacteria bacterium]